MNIQIYSDIHLEHKECQLPAALAEVAIVAGDVAPSNQLILRLQEIVANHKLVFYTPGNHDYYGNSIANVHKLLLSHKSDKLIYLYPGLIYKVNGYKFLGCSLWFGEEQNDYNKKLIANKLNDIKYIEGSSYEEFIKLGQIHKEWLRQSVDREAIVVTHYLPSVLSINPKWQGFYKNSTYINNCEDIILKQQPKLWVHGHTHSASDYYIGRTRICCNPKGYPYEQENYKPMIITIQ